MAVLGIATLAGAAAISHAESGVAGDVRVALDASFTPHALPRDREAPVRINLEGAVRSLGQERPPPVRRISFDLNRHGRLSTRGLPACPVELLQSTTTEVALKRCRRALVGHGTFDAVADFQTGTDVRFRGKVVAFNGRVQGRRAILVHVYGRVPIPAAVVLVFRIQHLARGRYGTVLTAPIPEIAGDLGYVTDIKLTLGRRYRFHGRQRSLIGARCAAPAGFPGAVFPFARGRFLFAGGTKVTTTLVRDCVVR